MMARRDIMTNVDDPAHSVSEDVKAMARELEREFGLRPLEPSEERPDAYYWIGHYTGRGALE